MLVIKEVINLNWVYTALSNILLNTGKMLIGREFVGFDFGPCLNTGITFVFFQADGNFAVVNEILIIFIMEGVMTEPLRLKLNGKFLYIKCNEMSFKILFV
jgi:hypothetical protein